MGDRTPSQLLRHMRNSLGNNTMSEPVLRRLWIDKLPTLMGQILAPLTEKNSLSELADAADKIHVGYDRQHINALSSTSQTKGSDYNRLERELTEIKEQLRQLTTHDHHSRSNSRSRQHQRSRSQSRGRYPGDTGETCWYHHTFGADAQKCHKPCDYERKLAGNGHSDQ